MSKLRNLPFRYSAGALLIGAFFVAARRLSKRGRTQIIPYTGPAGGWGSAKAVASVLMRERVPLKGSRLLMHQNKAQGFACVSCAWAKPKSRGLEFCENGAKATAWESDAHLATPKLFAKHTVAELLTCSDYQLEAQGRLTHPLRWDKAGDKYLPVRWEDA